MMHIVAESNIPNQDINYWNVRGTRDFEYSISYVDNLFDKNNRTLISNVDLNKLDRQQVIIIDSNVDYLYGESIREYYKDFNVDLKMLTVEVSEELKNFDTAMEIVHFLENSNVLRRSCPFIAIGGGVLLDLAGFAASLYRRGIPHIRIPTNLMAVIDASLGVKTGINITDRRNRLGTYYPPLSVYIDRTFLSTVNPRDISNGLGEALKLGVIKDELLFSLLENNFETLRKHSLQDSEIAPEVIQRSISGMLEELEPNLWELHLERCVDFGHSFSPLIEMRSLPDLLHGEAVALDVLFSCYLSYQRDLISEEEVKRVKNTMNGLGLLTGHKLFEDPIVLWEALSDTTRHRNGLQRLPLPKEIGSYIFVNDITFEEISSAAERMKA